MLKDGCPGSKEIRTPYPEDITCAYCGGKVEIWSDEPEAECKACGKNVNREMKPSCIQWCQFARECVGSEKFERISKALTESEGRN